MGLVGFESAPRYRELLYKLISEDLEFPPAGFTVESDRPEWSFLKDEMLWTSQNLNPGAVAAQFAFVQIFNPVGSGRIAVVTDTLAFTTAAQTVSRGLTTTVRGASGSRIVARDLRFNANIVGGGALVASDSLSLTSGTAAAFGTDTAEAIGTTTANTWTLMPWRPVIIPPGVGVVVTCGIVNVGMGVQMMGYSRQARPEELAL